MKTWSFLHTYHRCTIRSCTRKNIVFAWSGSHMRDMPQPRCLLDHTGMADVPNQERHHTRSHRESLPHSKSLSAMLTLGITHAQFQRSSMLWRLSRREWIDVSKGNILHVCSIPEVQFDNTLTPDMAAWTGQRCGCLIKCSHTFP